MRVAEEPFLTRDSVVAVLRPGELVSEAPFRTLRKHGAASPGFAVTMRSAGGQVLGRLSLYSALNADAARAFRLHDTNLARALAERAEDLERSTAAQRVSEAVHRVASRMPVDPTSADAPVELRRYIALRRKSGGDPLDRTRTAREWLATSAAWLSDGEERQDLMDAVTQLDRAASEARADLIPQRPPSVTTFFGVVRRMDAIAAEIEGDTGIVLVPREDLERRGLAVLDQAVSLLQEALPGGGSYLLPMPAVELEAAQPHRVDPPWTTDVFEGGGFPGTELSHDDMAWLERELAREPNAIPVAPLRLA
jgi:hypothetical protein